MLKIIVFFEFISNQDTFAFYTLNEDKLESEDVFNIYILADSV